MFFDSPIRPDLSLSTDAAHCDFLELDLDARTFRVRASGMQTPILKFEPWVEELVGVADDVPRYLFCDLVGYYVDASPDLEPVLGDLVRSGLRSFCYELPRGTLDGGGLDSMWHASSKDPAWDIIIPKTLDEYRRLNGMRRELDDVERDWRRLEAAEWDGGKAHIAPHPQLTAPGAGGFLS